MTPESVPSTIDQLRKLGELAIANKWFDGMQIKMIKQSMYFPDFSMPRDCNKEQYHETNRWI